MNDAGAVGNNDVSDGEGNEDGDEQNCLRDDEKMMTNIHHLIMATFVWFGLSSQFAKTSKKIKTDFEFKVDSSTITEQSKLPRIVLNKCCLKICKNI